MIEYQDFIKTFLGAVRCKSYVELGVQFGDCLEMMSPVSARCIGVDLIIKDEARKRLENIKNVELHECTTDDFFKKNTEKFDVIFVDAAHYYSQVEIDFNNSLKAIKDSGFILLHDTDPETKELLQPNFCHDAYRIIDYVRSLNEYDVLTLPTSNSGLTIVSRKDNRRALKFI